MSSPERPGGAPGTTEGRGTRAGAWLAVYGALAAAIVAPVLARPSRFMLDDAAFYLQVGHNFASTFRSTFNGVTLTNGYHPLWMLACSALSLAVGNSKPWLLHAASGAQLLLFAGTAAVIAATARSCSRSWWWSLVPATAYFWGAIVFGSEAFLNGFVLALFCWLSSARDDSARRQAWVGAVLGFAILARLDNVFIAFAYFAGRLLVRPSRQEAVWLVAGAGSAACVVVPYLATNAWYFGHLMPISGAIKSTLPHLTFTPRAIGKLGWLLTAISAASLVWVWRRRNEAISMALWSLNTGTILMTGYLVFATRHQTVWHWYYVPAALNLSLMLPLAIDAVRARNPLRFRSDIARVLGLALLAGVMSLLAAKNWVQARSWAEMWYEPGGLTGPAAPPWPESMARELDARLPPGTRVLVFDHPGYLAFFSRLAVIPSDGLMMDFDSDAYLRENGISAFLTRLGVGYLLLPSVLNPGHSNIVRLEPARKPGALDVRFFAPTTGEFAGSLHLPDACRVLDLNAVTPDRYARWLDIGLWRFPCSGDYSLRTRS
jgi:hypothetical protein